ncbi:putative tRNA synthetases class I (W and Y) [Trypanosoma vivax]|uniref:tyrosine--tRNA ligase n=1 Tax=Trypanosoma vivax (strain Y486) TaxID=1055687 RepID=G0TYH1_TRYVY|nr:putative tyrosyl-tRNA synthetase [Trypanosoma vivax]KAH8611913.1 putative tRNA synthetases class I (W and Y) [Trypanosoma vivax]CCC49018.1 putative tyrosyl-tRNA synthetase [Trypanosoma vivax Y486]
MAAGSVDGGNLDDRYKVLRSVAEECIQESELRQMLEKKPSIRCYDGFEPSGRVHIAQGVFKAINVNKCTDSGCEFVFWVADWFALMNDKVGGELERIRTVGKYLIEVWKASNMNMEKVRFLWSSDEITNNAGVYWKVVLDVARRNTIARIKKCCTIMGKQEGTLTAAQVLYPLMQCADVFFLKADICQLGLDQRKVNMLAREYCDLIGRKNKPVILSHHMLAGLKQGHAKMSKSDPDSAIFMEDTAEDVARKVRAAYCPRAVQKVVEVTEDGAPTENEDKNPVLDYFNCIVFSHPGATVEVGGTQYRTYEELERSFVDGVISDEALKEGLIVVLNNLLEPVRQHFAKNEYAAELLEQVKSFRKDGAASSLVEIPPPAQSERPLAVVWLPACIKFPLDLAVAICEAIKQFISENDSGEVVVVLPEWTAMVSNEVTGEEKYITAALELGVALLQSHYLPKERVRVVRQSELILGNPNEYWLHAINAGRRNKLQRVEELCGELKNAGVVIAALMHAADAAVLGATHGIYTSYNKGFGEIVKDLFHGKHHIMMAHEGVIPPLHRPGVAGSLVDNKGNSDDVLFLDDSDMDVRRKIKKAYCAPNEDNNPVLSVAAWLIRGRGSLLVEREAGNGGNVTYAEELTLRGDALAGTLHPGDLKQAITKALIEVCATTKTVLSSAEGKKHTQALRNAEKALSKKSS